MTAAPIISQKVRKVLPLCGSPVDAEALSACRRVGAILAKDGQTYVDLAAAVRTVEDAPEGGPVWDAAAWGVAAGNRARPYRRKVYVFTPAQTAEHRRMALWLRNSEAGRLSAREREFVSDISHQRRELTIAQADWLAAIHDRLATEEGATC